MKTRIFCKDKAGRDLFFIDLYDIPELNKLWLRFSTGKKWILSPETERLINCIEERLVPESLRQEFIQRLLDTIQRIPDIEQVYFPDSLISKDGSYSEVYHNQLEEIYKDVIPDNFEPLTQASGYIFEDICGHLYLQSKSDNVTQLVESDFIKTLEYSERLKSVYYLTKGEGATYFNTTIKTQTESIEIFWMNYKGKTELAFIVRIPE